MDNKAPILIVDDRPDKALALEAMLEDLGQRIVRASSGRDALRHILSDDFAVILLDINMPGMDGLETAGIIRQRPTSRHIPIIFITAFGDELYEARGYSLGAVDFIQTPFVPEVLKTKVAVFVDLYHKTRELRRQAEAQRQRAAQLQKLATAAVTINSAMSIEQTLRVIADTARDVIGTHQAITLHVRDDTGGRKPARSLAVGSFSNRYIQWYDRPLELDAVTHTQVARSRVPTRMTEEQLHSHPDWEIVKELDIPPVRGGILAAPLCGRDGSSLGVIYVTDRVTAEFTADDEAVLVQLAQMGSIAIENTLYSYEREANRAKDEFLATLSHELRTPLNAIIGWTSLMKYESLSGEVAHAIEVIDRNARAQAKLIEDLLEVTRITSGKLQIARRPMEVSPVLEAAIDAVRPMAEEKHVELSCSACDVSGFMGDPDRLQQVIWNLLSNAVKFSHEGGRVEVNVALENQDRILRIAVRDFGQGISSQFLPHVFERFRQADSSSTRRHGGLGIGLTIVQHIVQLHGGTVEVQSEGENTGAVFTVRLPIGLTPELPHDAPARAATANGNAARGAEPASLAGVRVLLVEDDDDAREVIAQVLRRVHVDVTAVSSAKEAYDECVARPPDVLISDISMPDEDGFSLIQRIRVADSEQCNSVPAIALTAHARAFDRERALSAGYQEHVAKPVNADQLINTIRDLIAHSPRPLEACDVQP